MIANPSFFICRTKGSSSLKGSRLNGNGSSRASTDIASSVNLIRSSNRSLPIWGETIATSMSLHLPTCPLALEYALRICKHPQILEF